MRGKELSPYSIEDARKMHSKRVVQKAENRILDILPEAKMTFNELSEWYLSLSSIKALTTYDRVTTLISNFNKEFGDYIVNAIKPLDLENSQDLRLKQGRAPATVDMEIGRVGSMIRKAFDNDIVSGHTLKVFNKVKGKLKKGSNARKRLVSPAEYIRLIDNAPSHLEPIIIVAYNTGMRKGELRNLKWSHIDRENMFIRLPKEITKEGQPKNIPINHHVMKVLISIPHALKHDFVFTYKGAPITHKSGFKKSFISACNKANIPYGRKEPNGITFHDIRRTVKTNMLNAGVDKVHRDMIVGHSLKGMDAYYLVPTEDSLREAMNKYTQWLDKQLDAAREGVDQNVDQI